MLWKRYDVFISYVRKDIERVQPLVQDLRRRGYRVFFDLESIVAGERWKVRLERSIRASRLLVLCWSENARFSEFVNFEYARAEGLRKKVVPWLLDLTPLPPMLEIQGIAAADPEQAAAALLPQLGWPLARRRKISVLVAALASAILGFAIWRGQQPPPAPPPWELRGEVTDLQTRMPIAGVEVDVQTEDGHHYAAFTDTQGQYIFRIPPPQPKTVRVLFRKQGYVAEQAISMSTGKTIDPLMERLR